MNSKLVIKCPVCGQKIIGSLCERCGYTHILFPSNIPSTLERFEQRRIEVMRKFLDRHKNVSIKDTQSSPISSPNILGVLVVRNLMTECHYVFPIYNGRNNYGAVASNEVHHHLLDYDTIGTELPDLMFNIDASEKEFVLIPNSGFKISANRLYIISPVTLTNEFYFFYSNLILFNAIKF